MVNMANYDLPKLFVCLLVRLLTIILAGIMIYGTICMALHCLLSENWRVEDYHRAMIAQ